MNDERTSVFDQVDLLALLPQRARERIIECCREEHYYFGELIVREGEPGDAYFILLEGRARVFKRGENGEDIPLNVLRAGDEFGEMALLEAGTRTASVRCSSDVRLYRLSREDFHRILSEEPELRDYQQLRMRYLKVHNFLRETSSFGKLPTPALQAFLEKLSPMSFARGETIVRQGDTTHDFFIIEKGRVHIYQSENGAKRSLAFCRAGDYFGEISAIKGEPRAASAETVTDCRLLRMRRDDLLGLMEAFPEFRQAIDARMATYSFREEARVPLDFSQEMLPADASRQPLQIDAAAPDPGAQTSAAAKARGRGGRWGKRVPFIKQVDEMDCGAASLAMVCRYFGRRANSAWRPARSKPAPRIWITFPCRPSPTGRATTGSSFRA